MDFVSEKLNSFTGDALSGVNEMKRKKQQQQTNLSQVTEGSTIVESAAIDSEVQGRCSRPLPARSLQSVPFGGDSIISSQVRSAPPIGFRLDLTKSGQQDYDNKNYSHAQPSPELGEKQRQVGGSDASLYEGDTWSRMWFQRVMILTLIRLFLFIRKVYEDFIATKTYRVTGSTGHYLVSAGALFLPTAIFTVYRVSRYLQVTLPARRKSRPALDTVSQNAPSQHSTQRKNTVSAIDAKSKRSNDDEEAQSRRALMGSPQQEDDGLVTARQSPSNLEDFQDSKSQQTTVAARVDETASPAPSTAVLKDSPARDQQFDELKESLNIDSLGDIPDKENTRIVIGASEQLLHGALFIFWQLKRQVDVVGYLVERSCIWRKPREDEKEELEKLRIGSDGLEWFQDFYAAFLAILAQVYTLGLHWTADNDPSKDSISKNSIIGPVASNLMAGDKPELSISSSAKTLSVPLHTLSGIPMEGKDLLIMSELIVSSAVVFSLLVAVRRRDDGPLTLGLSMLGWGSVFASRIIVIALSFVHIGWKIMIALVGCHIIGITIWVYKIAIDSHNGKASESEESKWEQQQESQPDEVQPSIELNNSGSTSKTVAKEQLSDESTSEVTSSWTIMEHVVLITQIFTLFALPSLFYWPIMFNLKMHFRPFKYLALILSENTLLIAAIWFSISTVATPGQWYLLGAVGGFSIIGFVFISLYISCKPSLTEYFARADEIFNEADRSGVYFEFCSRVFRMPDLSKHAFRRLMNQTEEVEEIEVIEV